MTLEGHKLPGSEHSDAVQVAIEYTKREMAALTEAFENANVQKALMGLGLLRKIMEWIRRNLI